jgi:hypothetical protein
MSRGYKIGEPQLSRWVRQVQSGLQLVSAERRASFGMRQTALTLAAIAWLATVVLPAEARHGGHAALVARTSASVPTGATFNRYYFGPPYGYYSGPYAYYGGPLYRLRYNRLNHRW